MDTATVTKHVGINNYWWSFYPINSTARVKKNKTAIIVLNVINEK